jgi:hypothetical protein
MRDTKIVQLTTRPAEVCASVVETLEEVLAEARAGDITAVAIAIVRPNGAINSTTSETDDVGTLLGAITLMQGRVTRECDDGG